MAVKEKLTMILESNPRVAGCIDLGQFEKLKELRESQEVQNLRQGALFAFLLSSERKVAD